MGRPLFKASQLFRYSIRRNDPVSLFIIREEYSFLKDQPRLRYHRKSHRCPWCQPGTGGSHTGNHCTGRGNGKPFRNTGESSRRVM